LTFLRPAAALSVPVARTLISTLFLESGMDQVFSGVRALIASSVAIWKKLHV
jgi:hypothetical protein